MKKSDANERNALKAIMDDVLKPFAPEFKKVVEQDDGSILLYLYLTHTHTHSLTHTHTHTHTHSLTYSQTHVRTHPVHLWHSSLLFPQQFQPSCIVSVLHSTYQGSV